VLSTRFAAQRALSGKYLKPLSKYSDEQLRIGLAKLDIDGAQADDAIDYIKNGTSSATSVLDDVLELQRTVYNQNKNVIQSASSNAKGNWGEIATDVNFIENGYKPLHIRKTTLTESWGQKGIDAVFEKDGIYYIVESKFSGTAKLGMTNDGKQMSDQWIQSSNRLEDILDNDLAQDLRDFGNYKRPLANVEPNGNVILKELDENGNILGDF